MIREVLAVALKELQVLFRDKGTLAVYFLLPLLFSVIMGGPAQLVTDLQEGSADGEQALIIPAYLVDEDAGAYGPQVADALSGITMLDITVLDSVAEADQLVADGEAPAAIIIPSDFTQQIEANESTQITVIADPTQDEMSNIVTGLVNRAVAEISILGELRYGIHTVIQESGALEGANAELRQAVEAQTLGVIWTQVQEMRLNPLIDVRSEDTEGEESDTAWNPLSYTIPAFTVMFAFFLIVSVGQLLIQERESGTLWRLMSSPMHRGSLIGGKMVAYVLVVFMQVVLLFSVGVLLFNIPLGSSPLALFLITLMTALAAVSLGLLIGALAKTSAQADQVGMILAFLLMAVGGCIFPFFKGEGFLALVSKLTPHAHAVQAYMEVMIDGAGVLQILPNLIILLGFAAVFFTVAVWRFRFE